MELLNKKLSLLKSKIENNETITILIIGLGSVGTYLLDYLVSLGDNKLRIVVAGRNKEKLEKDVNIIRTAASIRGQLLSKIDIISDCDLNDVESIERTLKISNPSFIVNTSRVYSGLKYGTISWHTLRAYGIWTPLSISYAKNIMQAYRNVGSNAITINTSYSDAVIPWLKSAGKAYFDFGSGNLNHLIPRMKFYVAKLFHIENLNEIDITLATSHFHDVVISKEGHSEGQEMLIDIKYRGNKLEVNVEELLKECSIPMPTDQKRNMMNASSNFNIIYSILSAIRNNKRIKIHSPGVVGMIGGYPIIIDSTSDMVKAYIDESTFSLDEMKNANVKSIYCDGIADVVEGSLVYTDELLKKTKVEFGCDLPKMVPFDNIAIVAKKIIEEIIEFKAN